MLQAGSKAYAARQAAHAQHRENGAITLSGGVSGYTARAEVQAVRDQEEAAAAIRIQALVLALILAPALTLTLALTLSHSDSGPRCGKRHHAASTSAKRTG